MVQTIQAFLKRLLTTASAALMVVFLFEVGISSAQDTIVEYTFTGDMLSPETIETGLASTDFALSSGNVIFGDSNESSWDGSGIPYAQGNSGWGQESAEAGKYFTFILNTNGAEEFDITRVSFLRRATNAGPSAMTVTINGIPIGSTEDVPENSTDEFNETVNLTGLTTAEVRIIGWDNGYRSTSGNGQFHVDDIKLEGSVTLGKTASIPYTHTFADFVFENDTEVRNFGSDSEWQFTSGGDILQYRSDWGSGTQAGFRGNSNVIGYQHTGSTGIFTAHLILRNNIGSTVDNLSISYDGRVERDDQGRSPEWAVSVNDSVIAALSYSTVEGIDKTVRHTVEGLHIQDGEFIYIEWKSDRDEDGDGSSRQIGIGNVSVTLEGQYAVSLTGTEGFRMLSVPVETSFDDFLSPIHTQGGEDPNVYTWDSTASGNTRNNWDGVTDLDQNITAGTGFLVYVFQDDEFNVDGSFPKTLSVSGAENNAGFTVDANPNYNGWALLGNPIASPIDFNELAKTNLTDNVYVWDVNNEGGTTQETAGSGSWQSYSEGAGTGDLSNGIIAPFQGFFVQTDEAGGSSVGFNEGANTTGGSFMGKEVSRDVVRLELNGQGMRNSAWLSFSDNGSMGQVYGDAHQLQPLSSNYALLAAQKTDGLYDISVLPSPDGSFELPLETDATLPGTYILSVTDFSASFGETLYLEDRQKGITVELNDSMEYEFTLDGHAQKAVPNLQSLLANGPVLAAKRPAEASRFYITSHAAVSVDAPNELPQKLSLSQNFPNPFNPVTVINFDIPRQSHVRLAVYDLLGRQVDVLVNDTHERGSYDITWDASRFSSGVYFYHLETDGQSLTRRMTLIK